MPRAIRGELNQRWTRPQRGRCRISLSHHPTLLNPSVFQLLYSAYLTSVNIIYTASSAQLEARPPGLVFQASEDFSGGVDPVLSSSAVYAAPDLDVQRVPAYRDT